MPILKSKSSENYRAAKLLSDDSNKMYSSSIHCAYYACFQFAKHILDKKCYISYHQQEENAMNNNTSSHKYIINEILNDLNTKQEDDAYDTFDENITELKRLRKIADYQIVLISKQEAHEALNMADETLTLLKGVYKGL